MKKPLIPENRKDIGKSYDDLLNAQKSSKPKAPVAEAPKALKSSTKTPVKAEATKVETKKDDSTKKDDKKKTEASKEAPAKAKLL